MYTLPPRRITSLLVIALVFLSGALLQGCDGLTSTDELGETQSATTQNAKLRHPSLLGAAKRTAVGEAGKSTTSTTDLFLAFNEYEANGITKRVLDKYGITKRILGEYGITRRVLGKYGITKRVLDQYGITRRVLGQYGITKRVLDKYGITKRMLDKYGNQVTQELLQELGINGTSLSDEGLTMQDIEDFNALTALLDEFGITIEQFLDELESYISAIRLKVYVDGAHLGITVSMESEILDAFLNEIGDDPDISFAEPDVVFDTTDLGTVVGGKNKSQIIPWGITNIATPLLSKNEEKKAAYQGVDVYVLDSGAMKHNGWDDLNFATQKDFTMLFENPDQLHWDEDTAPDVSGFDPGSAGNPLDESGHGIHIAGTIGAYNNKIGVVGVASGISLHSLKVLTKEGRTDITTLLAAVDYITRAKQANPDRPVVVNMSLGVNIGTTEYNVLDEAIEASIAEGVIYVVAAGNNGDNAETYSPAHVEDVITVGAYNEAGVVSDFSNHGPMIDILAPGENIVSLSHFVRETKEAEAILASGTSYAVPHVTGAIARYLGDHPSARAAEVTDALKEAATATLSGLPVATANRALNVSNLLSSGSTIEEEPKTKKEKKKK